MVSWPQEAHWKSIIWYQKFLSANSYANDLPIPKSKSISSGQYQDGYVALKQLPEYYSTIGDRNSVTNSRFQIEIDQIRELCQIQHNHLARFFGIYKSIDLPTSLVTEYGTKGSLQDLLEDNGKDTPVIWAYWWLIIDRFISFIAIPRI